MKSKVLLLLTIFYAHYSYAQPNLNNYLHNDVYTFDDTFKVLRNDLFVTYKSDLGLTEDDEMELIDENYVKIDSTDTIDIGTVHARFQQKHKGYIVNNRTMSTMSKCGVVLIATGNIAKNLNVPVTSPMSEEDALDYALNFINPPLGFSWENPEVINSLIELTKDSLGDVDSSVTTYPVGDLLITKKYDSTEEDPDHYMLCWRFQIEYIDTMVYDSCMHDSTWVYNNIDTVIKTLVVEVNANTGDIWSSYNLQTGAYSYPYGTVWTWFNGQRSVQTKTCGTCRYTTEDDARKIYALRFTNPTKKDNYKIGVSSNNSWVRHEEKDPATALWAAQMTHEYFKQVHQGTTTQEIRIYTNANQAFGSVYYPPGSLQGFLNNPNRHVILVASGFDVFSSVTLEYIAHEMTHALNFERGKVGVGLKDWVYGSAINEGFADIFGMLTETWVNGWCDWSFGDDGHWGMFQRSFHDPQNDFHPNSGTSQSHISGPNELSYPPYSGSGILRKWFNHFSQGEWDWTPPYSGATLTTASRVSHLTFYYLINNNPTFQSLAQNTLDVAAYHYGGKCNPVWQKAWRAWQDVGVKTTPAPCAKYIVVGRTVAPTFDPNNGSVEFVVKNVSGGDYEVIDYTWIPPLHWNGNLNLNKNKYTLTDVNSDFSSQEITVIVEYIPLGGGVHMYDTIKTVLHFSSECNDISVGAKPARLNSIRNYTVSENVSKIVVYPNPTHDHLTITGAQPGTTLLLMNTIGQQIYAGKTSHAHTVISTSQYAPGVYMLTLIDKNGNKDVRRIIKE